MIKMNELEEKFIKSNDKILLDKEFLFIEVKECERFTRESLGKDSIGYIAAMNCLRIDLCKMFSSVENTSTNNQVVFFGKSIKEAYLKGWSWCEMFSHPNIHNSLSVSLASYDGKHIAIFIWFN